MLGQIIRIAIFGSAAFLAACEGRSGDSSQPIDGGLDGGPLEDGVAAIWVSPDGCQYWVIDDGIEGYMAARLNRDGTPRCVTPEDTRTDVLTKEGTQILIEPEPFR